MKKKLLKAFAEVLLLVLAVWLIIHIYTSLGFSEARAETDVHDAYILCADYVNIRPFPNRKGEEIGRFESGQHVWIDGKRKNGYLHIVDTGLESDGWVYAGFIVYDKPERMNRSAVIVSNGRLAARKYVNGKRTRWLKPLATLLVYWWSDNWCVTDCGYVQSRYLELEGE